MKAWNSALCSLLVISSLIHPATSAAVTSFRIMENVRTAPVAVAGADPGILGRGYNSRTGEVLPRKCLAGTLSDDQFGEAVSKSKNFVYQTRRVDSLHNLIEEKRSALSLSGQYAGVSGGYVNES